MRGNTFWFDDCNLLSICLQCSDDQPSSSHYDHRRNKHRSVALARSTLGHS